MSRSIILLPVDLPKLNLDREIILEYFFERRTIYQDWAWVYFKINDGKIDPDLIKLFPDLDEKLRQLPFKDYDNNLHIDFRQQMVNVRPHQDPNTSKFGSRDLGPTAYKNMVVRDKLETFYVLPESTNPDVVQYDSRPIDSLNPVYPILPDDTNWFCINNHIGYHGAKRHNDSKNDMHLTTKELERIHKYKTRKEIIKEKYEVPSDMKITMFFSGPLDEQKHLDLIERSKEKYKDYIIYN